MSRRRLGFLLALASTLALLVAGCGSSDDTSSTSTGASGASGVAGASGEQGPTGAPVNVTFAQPSSSQQNQLGATLLKANRVPFLMTSFSNAFQLPDPLTVRGVNGFGGGPFFNPKDN